VIDETSTTNDETEPDRLSSAGRPLTDAQKRFAKGAVGRATRWVPGHRMGTRLRDLDAEGRRVVDALRAARAGKAMPPAAPKLETADSHAKHIVRGIARDLGGYQVLSGQQRQILRLIAGDLRMLWRMERALAVLLQSTPEAERSLPTLSQLDSYMAPVGARIAGNLQRLGLEKRVRVVTLQDLFKDAPEAEVRQ
jgi:hypothetical protein